MRTEFSIFKRKDLLIGKHGLVIFIYIIFFLFILPFFTWFRESTQAFNIQTIWQYIDYTSHNFPINQKQEETARLTGKILTLYLVFFLILPYIKLVVTPEKIFYSLFQFPLLTSIKREQFEYTQIAKSTNRTNWLINFLYKNKPAEQNRVYFFPLKNPPINFDLISFNESQEKDFLELLKQFYNFKHEPIEIQLVEAELQKFISQQSPNRMSPRNAYIVATCFPIMVIGMYLSATSSFIVIYNYPDLLLFSSIFIAILIPSFLWIYQDIKTHAFWGAFITSLLVTFVGYFFLLPILHGYYTENFGKPVEFQAKLIQIKPEQQIYQTVDGDYKFYINKVNPHYNTELELNQVYRFPAYYHWHTYTFNGNVILTPTN
jgi:hypothetical protein